MYLKKGSRVKSDSVTQDTYLTEFGNVDQTCEIFQIGAFIVEFPQCVVLGAVSLTKRFQCFMVISSYMNPGRVRTIK